MASGEVKLQNGVELSWVDSPGAIGRVYYQCTEAGHKFPIWNTAAIAASTLRAALATEEYLKHVALEKEKKHD